jgi:hypothetical protein
MKKTNNLESSILTIISRLLITLDFKRHAQVFLKNITEENVGWLGLNISKQNLGGGIGVTPIVGITFKPIEDVVQRILQSKTIQPTLTSSLGYVMPEQRYLEWVFPSDEAFDIDLEAEKIVKAINRYGEPFMKQEGDLVSIIRDLETLRFTNQTSASYRLPVAYGLAGRIDEAHAYLVQQMKDISDRNDIAAQEMRVFFNALLQQGN